ncbi:Fc.00g085080.m01.CDS01 [Cosmosporella sp. VM-42]
MSQNLCDACQKINVYTLSAYPAKVWVEKHVIERPLLNPSLLRPRTSLSPKCPMCQIFLGCIKAKESMNWAAQNGRKEGRRNVAFLSLVALPSDDYYEQFTDKLDHSKMSIKFFVKLMALGMYRIAWEVQSAEFKRKIGHPGLLRFTKVTVQMAFEGAGEVQCGSHEGCNSYQMDEYERLTVFVRPEAPEKLKSIVIGNPVRPVNSSMRTTWVQESLAPCLSTHQKCRQGLSGRVHDDTEQAVLVPTRLIDVTGKSGDDVPFLCVTKGRHGRYAALSYCWGEPTPGIPTIMLTKNTLQPFQTRLPAALPKTIQDSIDITKDLGYQYLWIDRFCIIQDDDEDWKREARNMCDIYEGASLTIAAMAAVSDQSGLYDESTFHDVALNCPLGDGGLGRIYIAPPYPSRVPNVVPFFDELEHCKWNLRGWVMQERLLSRRIVYFGKNRIFWECHEKDDSSINALPQKDKNNSTRLAFTTYGTKALILSSLGQSRRMSFFSSGRALATVWGKIVQNYSNRQLTKQNDKLIAIEGMAEALRTNIQGSEYLYGHWEHILGLDEGGLFWDPYGIGEIGSDQSWKAWSGAPSWSWACYPGRIKWPCSADQNPKPGKPLIKTAKFVANSVIFQDAGRFAGEKILQVDGIVIRTRLETSYPVPKSSTKTHMTYTGHLLCDTAQSSDSITHKPRLFPGDVSIHIDQPYDRPPDQFWVLMFSEQQCGAQFFGGTTPYFTCNFLVLGQIDKASLGGGHLVYYRLGWGSYVGKHKDIQRLIKRSPFATFDIV